MGVGGVDSSGWTKSALYVQGILEIAENGSAASSRYGQISADSNSLNLRFQQGGVLVSIDGDGEICRDSDGLCLNWTA